jgi:poly(hydroxyalkanoate) depolymerase family esterase
MTILSTWLASVRRAFASGNPAVVVWRLTLAFVVLFWSLTALILFGWIKLIWAFWLRVLAPARDATATTADASVSMSGQFREVADFGANPGELRMFVYMPKGLPVGAPLVVVLHGSQQSGQGYAAGAGWLELADRYKFALVCPQQTRANNGTLSFQWFSPKDTAREGGEAGSIAEMVRHVLVAEKLDESRVFVTGLSSGGAMTAVMLATYPEMFVAGAVIAGLPYGAADSVAGALWAMFYPKARSARAWGDEVRAATRHVGPWPKVSIWHGTADRVVKPASGEALADQWVNVHGLASAPTVAMTLTGRKFQVWSSLEGERVVQLHMIEGMAHGSALKTYGEGACGVAGRYLLDVGVNSSLEIAQTWGVAKVQAGHLGDTQPVVA